MRDENPRIMYGVIITVYVDRQTSTVRSFGARRGNEEMGKTRGNDRRANLLAYIRQLRDESLAGDSRCHDGESGNKSERPNSKKKRRRWIIKMMSKLRLSSFFRRKNRVWRYCEFVPDDEYEEGEAKTKYNSHLWKKLKHMVGGLSRGCIRSRRDS
ncbi:unnamed protein product [Cochlearia groenlandica]